MNHTIEDALEILAGLKPRLVNIRVDYNEKHVIKSIAKQVSNKIALTSLQLNLVLTKFKKYKYGLEMNNVNVDNLVHQIPLRMSLREIDRTIRISTFTENNQTFINIKFAYSKNFENQWNDIKSNLVGDIIEKHSFKKVQLIESNIFHIVKGLEDLKPVIENNILELYEKIKEVLKEPEEYLPLAEYDGSTIILKNVNKKCIEKIEFLPVDIKENIIQFSDRLKNYGVYSKGSQLIKYINDNVENNLVKSALLSERNRFTIDPKTYPITDVINIVKTINQWPVLVIIDENATALNHIKTIVDSVQDVIPKEKITVFFRLDKFTENYNEFNQYVRENNLNNFIDNKTQMVFISKERIPKPLIKAQWKPYCAISMCSYNYGKLSAFLDDFPVVYYYNNSMMLFYTKSKGYRPVVQL